jgi:hypothetical protein
MCLPATQNPAMSIAEIFPSADIDQFLKNEAAKDWEPELDLFAFDGLPLDFDAPSWLLEETFPDLRMMYSSLRGV